MSISALRHQSQQSVVAVQFPLAKYSYTQTLANLHRPENWSHLRSSDLSVVIEKDASSASGISSIQQKLRLCVVRGHENLEDLDLNSLAREATQQAIAKQTRNIKPSVAIIVKDPCIAVRYPCGIDEIRRFQLKFSSSRDYCSVLEILREINCPFSESSEDYSSRSASLRPDSSSSRIMTPITSVPSINNEWGQRTAQSHLWNQGLPRSHTTLGATTDRQPINASSPTLPSSRPFINVSNTTAADDPHKDLTGERASPRSAEYPGHGQERPITAPAYDGQVLDQILPPKRNLPFSKPGPVPNRQPANRFSRSSETALMSQQRTTSSSLKLTTASPRPHTAQSRTTVPATSSPTRQLRLELEDRQWGANQEQKSLALGPGPSASSPVLGTSIFQASSPGIGKPQLQDTMRPTDSLSTASPSAHDNPPTSHQPPVSEGTNENWAKTSDAMPLLSTDLSTFLATPEAERSQLVSTWICQQLEDDGFRALCQDVERVWQRIAFGS